MPTTNRTEPLFFGTTNVNTVNLGITTKCSMKCPKCSVDVPGWKRDNEDKHASVWSIIRDAKYMMGLRRVHITGGEPTLHPEFEEIAKNAKRWFRCKYLTLETNGFRVAEHMSTIAGNFDKVFITHYRKDAVYPGSPDNTEIINTAAGRLGDKLINEPPVVHSLQHLKVLNREMSNAGEATFECSKWKDPGLPAGWYNGLLYPCCVTVGIDRGLGIRVTRNWKTEIQKVLRGCESCLYRGT
jgi:hypothetical protein